MKRIFAGRHSRRNRFTTGDGRQYRIVLRGPPERFRESKNQLRYPRRQTACLNATALKYYRRTGYCTPDRKELPLERLRYRRRTELKGRGATMKPMERAEVQTCDGLTIQNKDSVKYLGTMTDAIGASGVDVERRLGLARGAMKSMKKIWTHRRLSRNRKLTLYKTLVLTVLLYNAECWVVERRWRGALEKFHVTSLRQILRKYPNADGTYDDPPGHVLKEAKMSSIREIIAQKKLKFFGNLLAFED